MQVANTGGEGRARMDSHKYSNLTYCYHAAVPPCFCALITGSGTPDFLTPQVTYVGREGGGGIQVQYVQIYEVLL